jgi:hypothetical protein
MTEEGAKEALRLISEIRENLDRMKSDVRAIRASSERAAQAEERK